MRLWWRFLRVGIHLMWGVLQMGVLFRFLNERRQKACIRIWSADLLTICGVELKVCGLPPMPQAGGQHLVCNHISWLDIFALNAVEPVRFVAKAEVAQWPVVGYLVRQAGTVFVARGGSRSNQRQLDEVAEILRQGQHVAVFPEGTTTIGDKILPFKSRFFQTAIDVQCLITPVLFRYPDENGQPDPALAYCGDTSMMESLHSILGQRRSCVVLNFMSPVVAEGDRRELSDKLHRQLADKLEEPMQARQNTSEVKDAYNDLGVC